MDDSANELMKKTLLLLQKGEVLVEHLGVEEKNTLSRARTIIKILIKTQEAINIIGCSDKGMSLISKEIDILIKGLHVLIDVYQDNNGEEYNNYLKNITLPSYKRLLTKMSNVFHSDSISRDQTSLESAFDFVSGQIKKGIIMSSAMMEYAALSRGFKVRRLSSHFVMIETPKGILPFEYSSGLSCSVVGRQLCFNKFQTRYILHKSGFSVVESKLLGFNDYNHAIEFVEKIGFPVVVKPNNLLLGKGVTTNIQTWEEFRKAWEFAFSVYNANQQVQQILIERHFNGDNYRLMVVGNQVVSVTQFKQVNVTGDGVSPILELIRLKNQERESKLPNPCYISEDSNKLDLLSKNNISLSYIPKDGENVVLSNQSKLNAGGDTVDVTDITHPKFKEIAIRALNAIPGIEYGGVDIISQDITVEPDLSNHIVSEIEFSAGMSPCFPTIGEGRDIAGAILDYYLSSTINKTDTCSDVSNNIISVGLLGNNNQATKELAIACSYVANMQNIRFFMFHPNNVNIREKNILGKFFSNGKWYEEKVPFPDVIYDRSMLRGMHKDAQALYDVFSGIPFVNERPGQPIDKLKFYETILESGEISGNVIPFKKVDEPNAVLEWLDKEGKVIIKPIIGRFGGGVLYVEKINSDEYSIYERGKVLKVNKSGLVKIIQKIRSAGYILQKYVSLRTRGGNPFDIRVHLVKANLHEWSVLKIYPRVGIHHAVISSTNEGGYVGGWKGFVNVNFPNLDFNIVDKCIRQLSIKVAIEFENSINERVQEVGLDIGLTSDGKLHVIELNANQPGVFSFEFDLARHAISFAKDLVKNKGNMDGS